MMGPSASRCAASRFGRSGAAPPSASVARKAAALFARRRRVLGLARVALRSFERRRHARRRVRGDGDGGTARGAAHRNGGVG